jgi:hypothetical protein
MPQYSAILCVGSNAIPMQEARHSINETIGTNGYNGV